MKEATLFRHMPPFWHGMEVHSSMSSSHVEPMAIGNLQISTRQPNESTNRVSESYN